jgi:hypothetical protein
MVFLYQKYRCIMSFETTSRSGTTPLANQLSTCYAVSMTDEEGAAMQAEYEASILCQSTLCPLSSASRLSTCYTEYMTTNRSALITALLNEYKFLCHDDFDPDVDATPDEYLAMLQSLSDDELIAEASDDDVSEFISTWQ